MLNVLKLLFIEVQIFHKIFELFFLKNPFIYIPKRALFGTFMGLRELHYLVGFFYFLKFYVCVKYKK